MKLIKIKYPIWATRSVGIADYKINDNLLIEILYENKDGERLWPEKFYISQSAAKPCASLQGHQTTYHPHKRPDCRRTR